MTKSAAISVMLALAFALFMAEPGEAVTCGQVNQVLAPCFRYLTSGGNPPPGCCSGVKMLRTITPTTATRRQACSCIKQAANHVRNIKPDAASSLPNKCKIQIGIPISMSTNCNQIP